MKIGLQLYTVREEAEEDLEAVLQTVSEQGYEGVELAGTYGRTPQEMKSLLEKYHLEPISAHVPLEELGDNREQTILDYKTIGCKTIVLPYLTEDYRYGSEAYANVLEQANEIGKTCKEMGLFFAYHNHDFEFQKTTDGVYVLDDMYDKIPAEYLQAELDTCWVAVAGESAPEYMHRYKERCRLIHIKDFKREEDVVLTPLGKGSMDLKAVIKAAEECGVTWLIVEQDAHHGEDALNNTKISINYLKEAGC